MTILEFLNRVVAFLGSILPYAFGMFLLLIVWGYVAQDDYDEDYVTFTVSCKSVIHDSEHYPANIVNYCAEMRRDAQ